MKIETITNPALDRKRLLKKLQNGTANLAKVVEREQAPKDEQQKQQEKNTAKRFQQLTERPTASNSSGDSKNLLDVVV